MTARAETLAAVLAEHQPRKGRAATNHKDPDIAAHHRAHVAAALDAALTQEGDRDEARTVVTRDGFVTEFNAQSDAEARAYKAGWADALSEVRDEDSLRGDLADRLAAVEALHHPVPDPEDRPGVVWCSCAGGSEERPYYEYADCPTVRALADSAGTLAKAKATALRQAAGRVPGLFPSRPLAQTTLLAEWLNHEADRVEASR